MTARVSVRDSCHGVAANNEPVPTHRSCVRTWRISPVAATRCRPSTMRPHAPCSRRWHGASGPGPPTQPSGVAGAATPCSSEPAFPSDTLPGARVAFSHGPRPPTCFPLCSTRHVWRIKEPVVPWDGETPAPGAGSSALETAYLVQSLLPRSVEEGESYNVDCIQVRCAWGAWLWTCRDAFPKHRRLQSPSAPVAGPDESVRRAVCGVREPHWLALPR